MTYIITAIATHAPTPPNTDTPSPLPADLRFHITSPHSTPTTTAWLWHHICAHLLPISTHPRVIPEPLALPLLAPSPSLPPPPSHILRLHSSHLAHPHSPTQLRFRNIDTSPPLPPPLPLDRPIQIRYRSWELQAHPQPPPTPQSLTQRLWTVLTPLATTLLLPLHPLLQLFTAFTPQDPAQTDPPASPRPPPRSPAVMIGTRRISLRRRHGRPNPSLDSLLLDPEEPLSAYVQSPPTTPLILSTAIPTSPDDPVSSTPPANAHPPRPPPPYD
jgi:hypothetical protein